MGKLVRLDGPGTIKMEMLDGALTQMQRVHAVVEQMAIAVREKKPSAPYAMQIRRAITPLIGQLKAQFGMLADQLSTFLLVATRGGSEQQKVRGLREQVALIRQAIEIAQNKVREQHGIIEKTEASE